MVANIKHISDGGLDPNTPTVEQMIASQEAGRTGKGTQSEDYAAMQACFNMGTGEDGGTDKTSYPRWSNDDTVAEYADGDGSAY